ncbi:MAG: glycerophosphodiester phosphodiesterase family protein [Ruminococcus sp.]
MHIFVFIGFIVLILCFFLFLIAPNTKRKENIKIFEKIPIAHRGFFDNKKDYPENTLPAFLKAINNGYGIELDVQMTVDEKLVVFHDENLMRMCGIEKKITDCTYEELLKYKVGNSNQTIPLFDDVLNLINGQVPVIVEIKPEGNWEETTIQTAKRLDEYHGVYCVESFNPFVIRWYKKNRPSVVRGQLSNNFFKEDTKLGFFQKFLLSNLMLNVFSRPDFIAYNHIFVNHFGYLICRTLFNVTNVGWTIRNQNEFIKAQKVFSVIIFDSFIPNEE